MYHEIQRVLMDTPYRLGEIKTDWISQNEKIFLQNQDLEKELADMFYIRADKVWLTFVSKDGADGFSYRVVLSDVYRNRINLPKKTLQERDSCSNALSIDSHDSNDIDDKGLGKTNLEYSNNSLQQSLDISDGSFDKQPPQHHTNQEADENIFDKTETGERFFGDRTESLENTASGIHQIETEQMDNEFTEKDAGVVPNKASDKSNIDEKCPFCSKNLGSIMDLTTITEKGVVGIYEAASQCKDKSLKCYIGQKVHTKCRKAYVHPHRIQKVINDSKKEIKTAGPSLRSAEATFSFNSDCVFCGKTATENDANVSLCRTLGIMETILKKCNERNDNWGQQVKCRLGLVHDLHAADAMYHRQCYRNFQANLKIPLACASEEQVAKRSKAGRPKDETANKAFESVVKYLTENEEEMLTIGELVSYMETLLEGSSASAYGNQYMKKKLQETFKDEIIFTEIIGRPNVVTFQKKAKHVLQEFHEASKNGADEEKEKDLMIQAAAKMIKEDIKLVKTDHSIYPNLESLDVLECLEFLPMSLRTFLKTLIDRDNTSLQQAALGQALMQLTRPRVIQAPLQIGLGAEFHHVFRARFPIDQLHKFGFSCSYEEVRKFEKNAAVASQPVIDEHTSQFMQYIADNVDHQTRTLDGHGTFHGMGSVVAITPAAKASLIIPRIEITAEDIRKVGHVEILHCNSDGKQMGTLVFEEIESTKYSDPTANLDLIWKCSIMFGKERASWAGTMQLVHKGGHPGRASVMFLPIIDLSSSDPTCIYSTLHYMSKHAKKHNCTPIVTFDQPLYYKAVSITEAEPVESLIKHVVIKMGGLHTIMSFLGSIGHLMANSGLNEALESIYAKNSVEHLLSGKAIARAIRGHLIVDAVLNGLLHTQQINSENEEYNQVIENLPTITKNMEVLYKQMMEGSDVVSLCQSDVLNEYEKVVAAQKNMLKGSRTAKLWLQYMDMIDLLRQYIRAERLGNWQLHLNTTMEMLPYFAASGHNNYLKSSHIYLQKMQQLPQTHPDVYHHFCNGLHVIRRSDRLWAGLSADLIIEQCLMRNLKTSGGLTHGAGMTDLQRTTWTLSMPVCAAVHSSMQNLSGAIRRTGEQNTDMGASRVQRDWKDTLTVIQFFEERSPFEHSGALCNIANGVHAPAAVNVDSAKEVGLAIISKMIGARISDHSFKRKDQVITLASKQSIKVNEETVQVDPHLLFQRLTMAGASDLESAMHFELCTFPPALFECPGLLNEAQKPALASAIWTSARQEEESIPKKVQFVIDGGALLHKIPWVRGSTFKSIIQGYVLYVTKSFGHAIVVFDGYTGSSTKDMTHKRRSKGKTGLAVSFTLEMQLTMTKENFLSNTSNKLMFIQFLGESLKGANCEVHHARNDADYLIARKAVQSAETIDAVLIGEDTDLLILLLFHSNIESHDLFFTSNPKGGSKSKVWNIKRAKLNLGSYVSKNILFIHAFLGCDTTSRLFGIGKGSILKKFKTNLILKQSAEVFDSQAASPHAIQSAGERALVVMYNGKNETLDALRYKKYCEKVATSVKHLEPRQLPPTSAAAKYHSYRVYLQVCLWKDSDCDLEPESWGWTQHESGLIPTMTDLPPAPESLIKIIRCNCSTDCSSGRCSCQKHGMKCSPACGQCHGSACSNASPFISSIDEDEDEEAQDVLEENCI